MRQIGPYRMLELLGKGGMGEVYLAEDSRLGRKVALKLLPSALTNDELLVRRFQQEARTASALNHPNILTIFDIGEVESTHFIATEFVRGETLRNVMSAGPMNIQKALNIVTQVASALGAAHEVGVVHRDIKPENIMVRPDGLVKVLDFGLAKLTQRTATGGSSEMGLLPLVDTEPGMIMGTPKYMSPEQVRAIDVDERTDMFSLGVVLYEMLTGIAPFERRTLGDTIAAILQTEPPAIDPSTTAIPPRLQDVIVKALRKDRGERYQAMGDFIGDLRIVEKEVTDAEHSVSPIQSGDAPTIVTTAEILRGETGEEINVRSSGMGATRTESSAEYILGEIKQHKRGSVLVLVLLLAAVAGIAYLSYSNRGSKAAINSVAVLPFINASNDPEMEYLSDGVTESLINSLSGLGPQLRVSARYSSFKYRGQDVDLQEVANALGVQAIVTGRVMLLGNDLQVSADLTDTRDNTQMWGERYTRRKPDLQTMQEEIARTISEKLRLRLTGAQERQLTRHATENSEAYQLYLNGVYYSGKAGVENFKKALSYYNKAVELDPNFALAYTGVAAMYSGLEGDTDFDPRDAMLKAKTAIRKALELDDTLAEAHLALATIKRNEWDWSGAESEYKRAIELNPNLAEARDHYSEYLSDMGRHAEALTENKRAQELNPLNISIRTGEAIALEDERRFDQAIKLFQNLVQVDPGYSLPHVYLGYAYAAKGLYAEAITEYEKYDSIEGKKTGVEAYVGYALAMSGKRDDALAILHTLKTTKEPVSQAELAILYAGLGNKEEAFAALNRACDAHDPQMRYLKVDSHYDSLRSDTRFTAIIRRVGLTP